MNNMNELKTMPHDNDVDQVLTEFFQSEMPRTFPALRLPRNARPASLWKRTSGRFALAAAVMLCLVGYLALAGSFKPREEPGLQGPEIGQNFPKEKAARPR